VTAKLELHRRRNRRAQKLSRIEKQRARAEAAYKKTKSHVWYARLRDLTTKALSLA
jgi:hypothetical protein